MSIGRNRMVCIGCCLLAAALVAGCASSPRGLQSPSELSAIAGWHGAAPNADGAFSFVVLADRTDGAEPGAWDEAVREVNLLKPDFVICVGDLIQGYTQDRTEALAMWKELEGITSKLDAPFFYCPGNHDTSNPMLSQLYLERHGVAGHPYYSFDYRGSHFVVLDSNDAKTDEKFAAAQIAWLRRDMERGRNAQHIFVFYHHPIWDDAKLWPAVHALFPAAKTTVFNGHTHTLSYKVADGVPTYVLAVTGAKTEQDRLAGEFRMLTQVSVAQGRPTVSVVPLGEVLPGAYAEFVTDMAGVARGAALSSIPAKGGMVTFTQSNPTSATLSIDVAWDAFQWDVTPEKAQFVIAPGAKAESQFQLTARKGASRPVLNASYNIVGLGADEPAKFARQWPVPVYQQMAIARVKKMTVDGSLADWTGIEPLQVAGAAQIAKGREAWLGPSDLSYALRAATDGEKLYVAIDVNDDRIATDAPVVYDNDTVEFFWDARAPQDRNGKAGAEGTGQLVLPVPATAGAAVKPEWPMGRRHVPEGLTAACKRREGGYVMEWAVPLKELGYTGAVAAGQGLNLEAIVDDRDMDQGKGTLTRIGSSGAADCYINATGYVRCTFE